MKRKIAYAAAGLAALVVIGGVLGDEPTPRAESRPIESDFVAAQPDGAASVEAATESGDRAVPTSGSERTTDSIAPGPAAANPATEVSANEGPLQDVSASSDGGATGAESPGPHENATPTTIAPAPAPTPTTTVPPTTTTTVPEIPAVDVDPTEIDELLSDIEQLLAGLDEAMQQGDDLP